MAGRELRDRARRRERVEVAVASRGCVAARRFIRRAGALDRCCLCWRRLARSPEVLDLERGGHCGALGRSEADLGVSGAVTMPWVGSASRHWLSKLNMARCGANSCLKQQEN